MNRKTIAIGVTAAAALLVTGWVIAQTTGPAFGPALGGQMHSMPSLIGYGYDYGYGHRLYGFIQRAKRGFSSLTGQTYTPAFADPALLDDMRNALSITPNQQSDWERYAGVLRSASLELENARASLGPLPFLATPERRYVYASSLRAEIATQNAAVAAAARELLGKLDESQKESARYVLPGLPSGPAPFDGVYEPLIIPYLPYHGFW